MMSDFRSNPQYSGRHPGGTTEPGYFRQPEIDFLIDLFLVDRMVLQDVREHYSTVRYKRLIELGYLVLDFITVSERTIYLLDRYGSSNVGRQIEIVTLTKPGHKITKRLFAPYEGGISRRYKLPYSHQLRLADLFLSLPRSVQDDSRAALSNPANN